MLLQTDFSYIEGTQCYCSEQAAEQIRAILSRSCVETVRYIGTGDYHYISLFRAELATQAFTLILYDNHPDDQDGAFDSGMLSCGNWVKRVRELPLCRAVLWNPEADAVLPDDAGVFFSIDLDVLSPEFAHTNWDQGAMTLPELCSRIKAIASRSRVLGADICGGLSEAKGGTDEDKALNNAAIEAIVSCLDT